MITLDDGEVFELWPETRLGMRSVYHIVAPSGAGKSTLAAGFARNFRELHPDGRIVVVSSIEDDDPAFEGVDGLVRIGIDETLNDICMAELAASSGDDATLVIADDVEGLDKKRKAAIEAFMQRALETGRKLKIHTLSLFHRAASGNATKSSLLESNGLAYFPKSNVGNLSYALTKHFGIDPSVMSLLKQDFGRWVLLRTDGEPSTVVGEKRAALYDQDSIERALKENTLRERLLTAAEVKAAVKAGLGSGAK